LQLVAPFLSFCALVAESRLFASRLDPATTRRMTSNQKTVHDRELFLGRLAPLALVTITPGAIVTWCGLQLLCRARRPDAPPVATRCPPLVILRVSRRIQALCFQTGSCDYAQDDRGGFRMVTKDQVPCQIEACVAGASLPLFHHAQPDRSAKGPLLAAQMCSFLHNSRFLAGFSPFVRKMQETCKVSLIGLKPQWFVHGGTCPRSTFTSVTEARLSNETLLLCSRSARNGRNDSHGHQIFR